MPRGITDQFLVILHTETRRARRTLFAGVVAVLFALELARLADDPRWGPVIVAYVVIFALTVGIVAWWAGRDARRRTNDLAERWHAWMRYSVGSGSIDEIERKVNQRPPALAWLPGLVTAAFVLANGLVFALLWYDAPVAGPAAYAMAAANAIALGWLLGTRALQFWWARSAVQATGELVGNGTLAVWGER
ncbi:MAG: hypothetical protein ACYDDF_10895 [Thermoplasmatota archaeon]